MILYLLASVAWTGRAIRRQRDLPSNGLVIVLTGTFYTDNWILTHLVPLAGCPEVEKVYMVATTPVPEIDGVVPIYPGKMSARLMGGTLARLVTFVRTSSRVNADIVGGFHLLLNGLFARAIAACRGTRSMYICGGGARELEGGGYLTQNKLFMKVDYPSAYIEKLLIGAACDVDIIITMGSGVRDYFVNLGARGDVVVNPGGFDTDSFRPPHTDKAREYDLVTVGRISDVKRLDILVRLVEALVNEGLSTTALIVGDGPLLASIREDAARRGLADNIRFTGWQRDVYSSLARSRIFVLTSESEGLSQALVQAMLCGLPAVVSNVGDLSDIVEDGINGGLVDSLDPQRFVEKLLPMLRDPERLALMSEAARQSAAQLSIESISGRWSETFNRVAGLR